jgi:hypothetical protein
MSIRNSRLARVFAVCLLLLAISPVMTPSSTYRPGDALGRHVAPHVVLAARVSTHDSKAVLAPAGTPMQSAGLVGLVWTVPLEHSVARPIPSRPLRL